MKVRRVTELTIETTRTVVTKNRTLVSDWCPQCNAVVHLLTMREAASLAFVSLRTICEWIASDQVHSKELPGEAIFVCLDSLRVQCCFSQFKEPFQSAQS